MSAQHHMMEQMVSVVNKAHPAAVTCFCVNRDSCIRLALDVMLKQPLLQAHSQGVPQKGLRQRWRA